MLLWILLISQGIPDESTQVSVDKAVHNVDIQRCEIFKQMKNDKIKHYNLQFDKKQTKPKPIPYDQLIQIVHRYNILPVTTRCNITCCFCSHHQNPPGIESFILPQFEAAQLDEMMTFLSEDQMIRIGESVSRIMEGEPFMYPGFEDVLGRLRKRFPDTPIGITTNGSFLDEDPVKTMAGLMPLEITLSLNFADAGQRQSLLRDKRADTAVKSPLLLQEYKIPFHGSVVALPHLTGWQELADTLYYLQGCGARTIRVFEPGFTRWGRGEKSPHPFTAVTLEEFIQGLADMHVPISVEPHILHDLLPVVGGIIKGSAADAAGLQRNDLIQSVNGHIPVSRVDAFQMLKGSRDPVVAFKRERGSMETQLMKKKGETPGIVMSYDIDPHTLQQIEVIRREQPAKKVVLAVSSMAAGVFKAAYQTEIRGGNIVVMPVQNGFFGGNIRCGGLLVVEDFIAALSGVHADLVLLPPAAFDHRGRDLKGEHFSKVEEALSVPVALL